MLVKLHTRYTLKVSLAANYLSVVPMLHIELSCHLFDAFCFVSTCHVLVVLMFDHKVVSYLLLMLVCGARMFVSMHQ